MNFSKYFFLSICCRIVGYLQEGYPEVVEGATTSITMNYVNAEIKMNQIKETADSLHLTQVFNVTDYEGIPIKFAVADHPPYLILGPSLFGFAIDGVYGSGQAWDVLDCLSKFFNFRPLIVKSNETSLGYKNASGDWQGIVGLLARKEADVTLLPVTLTSSRKEAIDFSVPLSTSHYGILVKRPANSSKPDALLKPFTYGVWAWILGSMGAMGPLIYLITRIRVRLCKGDPRLTRFISLDQCIWFVFGAMMKQGTTLEPIADSSRILFATWWIYTVIVTAFYTANLTAFLTFNGLELSIHDVSSLESESELAWLAPYDESLIALIETHNEMEILRKMQREGRGHFMYNSTTAIEMVRNGTHVYIDDIRVLEYVIYADFMSGRQRDHVDKCDFYTAPLEEKTNKGEELDLQFYWGFAYAKNTPFKTEFDVFFQRLNSYGIISFLHHNYSSSTVCEIPKGFKDRPLVNKDLLTTYFMVLVGAVLSGIAFSAEFIYGKTKGQQQRSTKSRTSSHIFFTKPDKNSFLPAPIFHEQFVPYSHNLPMLPKIRPKAPFHIKYPESSEEKKFQYLCSQYKGEILSSKKMGSRFETSKKTRSQTVKDLKKTEMALLVSPFSKEENQLQDKQGAIVEGTVNGLHVLWNQRENKLIVKDPKRLEESIVYIDGVPCIYVESFINNIPHFQKLILNDYVY